MSGIPIRDPVESLNIYQDNFDPGVAYASGDRTLATRPTTGEGLSVSPNGQTNYFEGRTPGEPQLTRR